MKLTIKTIEKSMKIDYLSIEKSIGGRVCYSEKSKKISVNT